MTASDLSPRQQRLAAASVAAAGSARSSAVARRSQPPGVGDRYLLPATSAFPVEWVLLERRREPPAFLAVLADIHPLVGSADLAVPAGDLRLRCRARVWLEERALDPALRAGALDRLTVEKARRRILELDRDPHAAAMAGEVDSLLEYQDWQRDVIAPALAAVREATPAEPPAEPERPHGRGGRGGREARRPVFLAAAASVLFLAGLATLAGIAGWQSRRIDHLAAEKQAAQTALRREHARQEQVFGLAGQDRQQLAATARQATAKVAELERRLAEIRKENEKGPAILRALVNVPVAILYPAEVLRGEGSEEEPEATRIKAGALDLTVVLNLDPEASYPTYRAVLKREGNPAPLWQNDHLESMDQRVQLSLDSRVFSPGAYRFDLYGLREGRAEPLGEYELTIER